MWWSGEESLDSSSKNESPIPVVAGGSLAIVFMYLWLQVDRAADDVGQLVGELSRGNLQPPHLPAVHGARARGVHGPRHRPAAQPQDRLLRQPQRGRQHRAQRGLDHLH